MLDPDKGPDLKQLTQSRSSKAGLSLSPDEKSLWWLDGGHITSMGVGGGKTTTYNFRVVQRRETSTVRAAAFDEATWVMGSYFYDSEHHGIDWQGTARRYRQALDSVSTGDEYGALCNELFGELNSSHQGFYASDSRTDRYSESTGCLGLMFDPGKLSEGMYQLTEVLKDGPCDLPEGKPEPGAILMAVNGRLLERGDNLAALLVDTVGKKTVLTWTASETTSSTWDQPVKPVSRATTYGLYYERWVQQQRDMVERLSKGRLGYVHIQAMDGPSLAHFKHELGDEMLGKEGVVIDVRYNGGEPLETDPVREAIADGESQLGKAGRVLIRKSGTEPVIRVMAEGDDEGLIAHGVDRILGAIGTAAA